MYDKFQALGFGIYTGPGYAYVTLTNIKSSITNYAANIPYMDSSCPIQGMALNGDCILIPNDCGCRVEIDAITCEDSITAGGQCYLGKADIIEDVEGRMAIMEDAVNRAYELSDKDEGTLKIFNAPEFYWRGKNGAYAISSIFDSDKDFNAINQIGFRLQQLVEQAKFKDWVFIFGTIIASNAKLLTRSSGLNDYLNFAPIYKGFDPNKTLSSSGMRFLAPKRYVSGIDFISAERGSGDIPNDEATYYDNDEWKNLTTFLEGYNYHMIYTNKFVMNDILFSLEICLDHSIGVAQNGFLRFPDVEIPVGGSGKISFVQTEISDLAQISLVTSAGMSIQQSNLVLKDNGSIFLQDGLSPFQNNAMLSNVNFTMYGTYSYDVPNPIIQEDLYSTEKELREKLQGLYALPVDDLKEYDSSYFDGRFYYNREPKIRVFPTLPIAKRSVDLKTGKKAKIGKSKASRKGEKKGKKTPKGRF